MAAGGNYHVTTIPSPIFGAPSKLPSHHIFHPVKYTVPAWNVMMEWDIARVIVLLVLAGIPIGWGIRLSEAFPKKKTEEKADGEI